MALVEVVKYNGSPGVLVWKYPNEELGTWTQLIVNDAQEAVLFFGGAAYDVFGSGRHTLTTDNIPILNNLINLPFGGRSPFTAEVWYVNRLHVLDIKWGTPTPIQIQDPKYGILTPVRAHGQFGIRIQDSRRFIGKLVGTMREFDKDSLTRYFRGLFVSKAKDSISSYLVRKKISMVEINAYLEELAGHILERIKPVMAEYGIELLNFYVNDVSMPENDPGVIQLKNALAKRAEMNIIGYDYRQERAFNTMEGAAGNPGSGSSVFLGAGLGLGLGNALGKKINGLGPLLDVGDPVVECAGCRGVMPANSRFCPHCGQEAGKAQARQALKCDKCGALLKEGAKFCSVCGDAYYPCPKCGQDLPEEALQCNFCGFVLPGKCPLCGEALNDSKARFCPNCGGSLLKRCAVCQAELGAGVKFCPGCGAKVDPAD